MLLETIRRRLDLYGHRALHSIAGGLRHPCLFMHLPKCGGTSLAAALAGTVPLHQRIGVVDALSTRRAAALTHFDRDDLTSCHEDLENGHLTFGLREQIMLTGLAHGARLVHGHMLFSDCAFRHFGNTYKMVTLMRDPLARALSNFRMAVAAGIIPNDLDHWLNGQVGHSMARVYLRYLCGSNRISDAEIASQTARALQNLEKFALIGFLDDLAGFETGFADLFGPRPRIRHLNRARASSGIVLSADQTARLERLLVPDRVIFAAALARFAPSKSKSDVSMPSLVRPTL